MPGIRGNVNNHLRRLLGGARAVTHVTPTRKMDVFFIFVVDVSVSYLVFLVSRDRAVFVTQTDRFYLVSNTGHTSE